MAATATKKMENPL